MWKLGDDAKLHNKLRQWTYYLRNTSIPSIGTTGLIKVEEKILAFHNLTKEFELTENTSTLSEFHKWKWQVHAADDEGWSKITNVYNGLFLTSKLNANRRSILAVEKEGMKYLSLLISKLLF